MKNPSTNTKCKHAMKAVLWCIDNAPSITPFQKNQIEIAKNYIKKLKATIK